MGVRSPPGAACTRPREPSSRACPHHDSMSRIRARARVRPAPRPRRARPPRGRPRGSRPGPATVLPVVGEEPFTAWAGSTAVEPVPSNRLLPPHSSEAQWSRIRGMLKSHKWAPFVSIRDYMTKQDEHLRQSWRRDSNPQPADYKSAALPVELRQRAHKVAPGGPAVSPPRP